MNNVDSYKGIVNFVSSCIGFDELLILKVDGLRDDKKFTVLIRSLQELLFREDTDDLSGALIGLQGVFSLTQKKVDILLDNSMDGVVQDLINAVQSMGYFTIEIERAVEGIEFHIIASKGGLSFMEDGRNLRPLLEKAHAFYAGISGTSSLV